MGLMDLRCCLGYGGDGLPRCRGRCEGGGCGCCLFLARFRCPASSSCLFSSGLWKEGGRLASFSSLSSSSFLCLLVLVPGLLRQCSFRRLWSAVVFLWWYSRGAYVRSALCGRGWRCKKGFHRGSFRKERGEMGSSLNFSPSSPSCSSFASGFCFAFAFVDEG